MNKSPKISVIVPVYNSDNKIGRLLDSVLNQTFSDFEIIIINDGSTDNSQEIIDTFEKKDSRVFVLHQENKGVSAARNKGIEHAKGEYVVFYDSDDIVPQNALMALYNCAITEKADMVIGGRANRKFGIDKIHKATARFVEKNVHSKYEMDMAYFFGIWNRIFRLDIIQKNSLRFRNLSITEDGVFVFDYLPFCNKIASISEIVYIYEKKSLWEGTSLSKAKDMKALEELLIGVEYIRSSFRKMIEVDKPREPEKLIREFDSALAYHTINVFLLNTYYRNIWILQDDVIEAVLEKYYEFRKMLLPEQQEQLRKTHSDIVNDILLKTKESIVKNPSVAILIADNIASNDVNDILNSLYNQMFPMFNVYMGKKTFHKLCVNLINKENLNVIRGKSLKKQIRNLLRESNAEMVMVLDQALLFDNMALKKLVQDLTKNPKVMCVEARCCRVDILANVELNVTNEEHARISSMHGNKLVRKDCLMESKTRKLFTLSEWDKLKTEIRVKKNKKALIYKIIN